MLKKIALSSSLLLLAITCIIFSIYLYMSHALVPKYEQQLYKMSLDRADKINTYLNNQEQNATHLSQEILVINALTNNTHDESERQSLAALIAAHKDTMDFKNIFLIDSNETIIFSTTKQNIVGTTIDQSTSAYLPLTKSYERASMSLTNDFSYFSFSDILQEPALFITIPILKEKKFIGALSYQLDQEQIYLIAHQYIGLQKTGEVILAKKEGSDIVFVAPTRNDADLAFKKRAISIAQPLAVQASALGQDGSGIAIDYRNKRIIGAWQFIPKLDWGMLIKIDFDEIMTTPYMMYNLLLFLLILLLISLLAHAYIFSSSIKKIAKKINHSWPYNKIPALIKTPFFIALLIVCALIIKNIISYKKEAYSIIEQAKHTAIETVTENAETITTILKKIAFVGQSLSDDLRTGYLAQDDIIKRLHIDLKENNIITEITLVQNNNQGQSTLYSTNEKIQSSSAENIIKTQWYTQAKEKKNVWLININKDEPNAQPTATYALTLYDKENKETGVIAINFSLQTIIAIVANSGIGQTGYSMITTADETFIYHPINNLVQTEITLLQYAESKGNEELATIAEKVMTQKELIASYSSDTTNELMWIYTHQVTVNNWIIGSIFSEEEINLPDEIVRRYHFWILVWSIIAILLLCALLWNYTLISLTHYAIITNIILVVALIMTWYIIKKTTTINRESRTIITDQSNLNKFLNDLTDEAARKHEAPPITIPSGILLYSLSNIGPDSIVVSGYLWNKYNTKIHAHIIRGMDLPQATRMVYGTPLLSKTNDEETSTWNIQGSMYHEQKYSKFPFDQQQLRIILEHKDIEKNIILTPDLDAYKKISPESAPGLDKEFSLPGFTIEQTFFEYQKVDPNANFGLKEYGKVTDNYHLIYNAIINRNLLNPFVIYVLPLLVILFMLFTTLLVVTKNTLPLSILGSYSALFFALILLQRSLREQYPSGTTLYMEYAFFYTYITIILLIIHTILMYYHKQWKTYQHTSLHFMKILFWPFQLIAWLITTFIIFY